MSKFIAAAISTESDSKQSDRSAFARSLVAGIAVAVLPYSAKVLGIAILATAVLSRLNPAALRRDSLLVFFYTLVAVLSCIFHDATMLETARFGVIWPAYVVACAISESPRATQVSVKQGLLLGCAAYCLFLMLSVDWGQLANPAYRGDKDYDVFMALCGAVLGLAGIELILRDQASSRDKVIGAAYCLIGFMCPTIIVKSRGYTSGTLVAAMLMIGGAKNRSLLWFASINAALLAVIFHEEVIAAMASVGEIFSLFDGTRDIRTGTGRFDGWRIAITDVWPQHPWIGHGANSNFEIMWNRARIHGAHNVVVANLIDFGIVGCAPIVLLLVTPPFVHFVLRARPVFGLHFYLVGLVGVLNENLLFNFGTPGSLIVLASLASLQRPERGGSRMPGDGTSVRC